MRQAFAKEPNTKRSVYTCENKEREREGRVKIKREREGRCLRRQCVRMRWENREGSHAQKQADGLAFLLACSCLLGDEAAAAAMTRNTQQHSQEKQCPRSHYTHNTQTNTGQRHKLLRRLIFFPVLPPPLPQPLFKHQPAPFTSPKNMAVPVFCRLLLLQ